MRRDKLIKYGDILRERVLIPSGYTAAVQCKDGGPSTHGIITEHGNEDHNCCLNKICTKNMINSLVEAWYSLEQYIGLKEDKLSSTTVDFIRPDEVHSSG